MPKSKIMICDDDEGILDLLRLILVSAGFEVITEADSLQITNSIEDSKPDLLLLDFWMRALNGDQVLRKLKSSNETAELPVIMISASYDAKEIALASGASGFISKPFQIAEVIDMIKKTLANVN